MHRYRPEIPEPAPSLSRHGAQIGGFRGFPHNQNNRDSSGAYVLWSERKDTKHARNAARCVKIMDAFCVCLFPHMNGKNLNTTNCSSIADHAITQSGIGVLGSPFLAPFYICGLMSPLCSHSRSTFRPVTCHFASNKSPIYFTAYLMVHFKVSEDIMMP